MVTTWIAVEAEQEFWLEELMNKERLKSVSVSAMWDVDGKHTVLGI